MTPSNCSSMIELSSSDFSDLDSLGGSFFCVLTDFGKTGVGFAGGRLGLTERGASVGDIRLDLGGF